MKRLSNFFYQNSTWVIALVLTILTFSYLYLVMIPVAECFEVTGKENVSLGTSFGFSFEVVEEFMSTRTAEMIDCYRSFNTIWDSIFALLYGLMYTVWLSFLLKPLHHRFKLLNLLPLGQTIFDWLENFQLSAIAYSFATEDQISKAGVQLASVFSMAKWTCSILIFLLILIGIFIRIRNAFFKKQ